MKSRPRGILIGAVLLLSAGLVWQQQKRERRPPAPDAALPGIRDAVPGQDPAPGKGGVPDRGKPEPTAAAPAMPDRAASPAPAAASPAPAPSVSPPDPATALTPPAMAPEPLISPAGKQSLIARDGAPLRIELVPGHPASAVELQAWTEDQNRNAAGQYPWRFKIKVVAGGLLERPDPAGFLAPESGYTQEFEQVMNPASAGSGWRNTLGKSFFVRLDDGTFGLLNVQMVAGGAHFVTVKSYLNPATGSRNLTLPPRPPTKTR